MNFVMPVMEPCFFCELARGTQGWNILVQDPLTMTVLNGRQHEPGQCIVFPKRHAATLLDLSAHEAAAIMLAAQRIARSITRLLAPEALLLYQNNGVLAGQEVPHFHLHVVPRTPGSDWGVGPPHLARVQERQRPARHDHTVVTDEKLAMVERLRKQVADESRA